MERFQNCRTPTPEERLRWFREAKFGMFIHWGVYAHLAGSWNGEAVPGIGEQIMRFGKIPVEEYRRIAAQFNPCLFDADCWVRIAKDAGMRYIVITAKHHDGFAMYHSKCSPYNIVDATPFGRDPMKELADACAAHGLRLCFYYSHRQDWDDPDGFVSEPRWDGAWPAQGQVFEDYMERKALPQVLELLTGYGPVGLIWYDTPGELSDYNARRFEQLVHAIQPQCIVSPRVSNNPAIGDYAGYADNQVPADANPLPWETCATMNNTWGFKAQDHNWKSPKRLIRLLSSIVCKGGNYLLNVGPTGEGEIPASSVERLAAVGRWMRRNGDAVYGAVGAVLRQAPAWGGVAVKGARLFLFMHDWKPGRFVFTGLEGTVLSVRLLADGRELAFSQQTGVDGLRQLILTLPEGRPDEFVSVTEVTCSEEIRIVERLNDAGGRVELSGFLGERLSENADCTFRLDRGGVVERWSDPADFLRWQFTITEPGCFAVELHTMSERYPQKAPDHNWEGGHELSLHCGGRASIITVTEDERYQSWDNAHWDIIITHGGVLHFHEVGTYTLELRPRKIIYDWGFGPKLKSLVLRRQENAK